MSTFDEVMAALLAKSPPVVRSVSASKHRGVYREYDKWLAQIRIDGRNIRLGVFANKEDAAIAFNYAVAHYHFGKRVAINKIEGWSHD